MTSFHQTRLLTHERPAGSLTWRGDDLVDWVNGGDRWTMEGDFVSARRSWGYSRLDAAIADPSGRWVLVHEETGTAGILLHDGGIVREVHRSPYHADAFLYPACLFPGPKGRVLLAHCPDSYERIEIDDAESGERLTPSASRKNQDFFHSRLAVSPGTKRLMSAGWVWHPWDVVVWFDIAAVLENPTLLDRGECTAHSLNVGLAEESSGAWLDDDHILLGSSAEQEDGNQATETDEAHPGPRLRPKGLAIFDLRQRRCVKSIELGYPPGTMMPVGRDHVVTFFERPRLVSLQSGKIEHEWALDSGQRVSSIVREQCNPALAIDQSRTRFAVSTKDAIEVVTFQLSAK